MKLGYVNNMIVSKLCFHCDIIFDNDLSFKSNGRYAIVYYEPTSHEGAFKFSRSNKSDIYFQQIAK